MEKQRRSFLKKAAITSAVAATAGTVAVMANSSKQMKDSNGVVIGKSNKKEILYTETKSWDEYYKRAL